MNRLFIDTSGNFLSILLKSDNQVLASLRLLAGRRMNELLLCQIDNMFSSLGLSANDIDEYYSVIGPGSFTGVRIGVAMVMGLSEGASKKAFGLTSLDLMALESRLVRLKSAFLLRDNIYAVREYDFDNQMFSDYKSMPVDEKGLLQYSCVSNCDIFSIDLERALEGDRFILFRRECVPLYLRKSEAEINLDKRSDIK